MTYLACELLAKLRFLTLVGQNEEGELEFIGSNEQWLKSIEQENGKIQN